MGKIGPFVGLDYEIGLFVGIGPVVGIGLFGGTGLVVSLTYILRVLNKSLMGNIHKQNSARCDAAKRDYSVYLQEFLRK